MSDRYAKSLDEESLQNIPFDGYSNPDSILYNIYTRVSPRVSQYTTK